MKFAFLEAPTVEPSPGCGSLGNAKKNATKNRLDHQFWCGQTLCAIERYNLPISASIYMFLVSISATNVISSFLKA